MSGEGAPSEASWPARRSAQARASPGKPPSSSPPQGATALEVPFPDRAAAGRMLLSALGAGLALQRPVVVALARGGVPVGAEVARGLGAPLYALPVSKVGAPGQEELAVGAVAPGGVKVLNDDVVSLLGLAPAELEALVAKAAARAEGEWRSYYGPARGGAHEPPDLAGQSALVVDDGLATGATMRAAVAAVRQWGATELFIAVPVAPPEALAALAPLVEGVVCLLQPRHMRAVGAWYEDFTQTTDEEVRGLLAELGPGRAGL